MSGVVAGGTPRQRQSVNGGFLLLPSFSERRSYLANFVLEMLKSICVRHFQTNSGVTPSTPLYLNKAEIDTTVQFD
jgi:hypothetical protein